MRPVASVCSDRTVQAGKVSEGPRIDCITGCR